MKRYKRQYMGKRHKMSNTHQCQKCQFFRVTNSAFFTLNRSIKIQKKLPKLPKLPLFQKLLEKKIFLTEKFSENHVALVALVAFWAILLNITVWRGY